MTEEVREVSEATESQAQEIPQTEAKSERDPVAALTEDLQRLQAEYSNYKKRVDRDRLMAGEIATAGALIELLPILDDLDRAGEHGELSGGFKAVADQFQNITKKLGLEKFGETPSTFDPNIHEALMHETSSEVKETTVTKILQFGYRYKERILRPARVVVTDPEHGN
jgi:molecular chaperone GrpE